MLGNSGLLVYNPEPTEIIHFDVSVPLLGLLRQWPLPVRLVKVKCYTGCLMNNRGDEQAENSYATDAA